MMVQTLSEWSGKLVLSLLWLGGLFSLGILAGLAVGDYVTHPPRRPLLSLASFWQPAQTNKPSIRLDESPVAAFQAMLQSLASRPLEEQGQFVLPAAEEQLGIEAFSAATGRDHFAELARLPIDQFDFQFHEDGRGFVHLTQQNTLTETFVLVPSPSGWLLEDYVSGSVLDGRSAAAPGRQLVQFGCGMLNACEAKDELEALLDAGSD